MSAEEHDEIETPAEAWESRDSGPVPMPPSRRRARVSEVGRESLLPASPTDTVVTRAVGLNEIARIAADLARRVGPELDEEEVLAEYIATIAGALPGRRIACRILGGDGEIDLLRTTERLQTGRQEFVRISRKALARSGMSATEARKSGIEVTEHYLHDFDDSVVGFDLPLVSGGAIIGTVGVEYDPNVTTPVGDVAAFQLLLAQLSSALGRARLRHEASYLNNYLSRLLDHANVPIVVLDRQHRVQVVSHAMLTLTKWQRSDFVKSHIDRFTAGELSAALTTAQNGGLVDEFEMSLATRDSDTIRLSINLVTLVNPYGEREGTILIGRDMTEVKNLEKQVIQAEKLATIGQLAAGVVHELNNPLTSISVYGEYLFKKGQREGAAAADIEKLRRIVQAAERILRFARDLVTYARPSTESPRALRISDALDEASVFCEHVIAECSVTVNKQYAPALPMVMATRAQLHQVFINLITNACQAMPSGAGQLTLLTRLGDDEATIEIEIRDNGPGIPVDQQNRIFEPFFSTKGEGKGTGLGLSIVRNIIERHSGEVALTSEPGRGSSFYVRLPALK